jgi:hypothetical protein
MGHFIPLHRRSIKVSKAIDACDLHVSSTLQVVSRLEDTHLNSKKRLKARCMQLQLMSRQMQILENKDVV